MNQKFQNPLILEILESYKSIWALGRVLSLSEWDMSTYMPRAGAKARAELQGKLTGLSQKLFLDSTFKSKIQEAEKLEGLNDYEKGVVRVLKRELDNNEKLPESFVEDFAKATAESFSAWEEAKKENDFKKFEPYLQKVVDLTIQKAEYLGYKDNPYNALLDLYEEKSTAADVTNFFNKIKEPLKELYAFIKSSPKYKESHELEDMAYDKEILKGVNLKLLQYMQYDPMNMRIDESAHPFTSAFSQNDARITTRYKERDFSYAVMATAHEYGHGLYDLGVDNELEFTPVGYTESLVLHESQSRFWENMIFRTPEVMEHLYEDLQKISPEMGKYSTEDLYYFINMVKPGLVRTEADEVTYHFHIMLRFEIENMIVNKQAKVSELPELWNSKMDEYLGVRPDTDTQGAMQDVHWSQGYIGYFPTYSQGTFLSGMWKEKMESEIGTVTSLLSNHKEGIAKIKEWFRINLHQYGSVYDSAKILDMSFEKGLDPEAHLKYLNEKFRRIYS